MFIHITEYSYLFVLLDEKQLLLVKFSVLHVYIQCGQLLAVAIMDRMVAINGKTSIMLLSKSECLLL